MLTLQTLTEDDVRRIFEPEAVDRAVRYLASGKVVDRDIASEDHIVADWDENPHAPHMELYNGSTGVGFSCECREGRAGRTCDHVVTLALAWVRERETFQDLLEQDAGEWEDWNGSGDLDQDDLGAFQEEVQSTPRRASIRERSRSLLEADSPSLSQPFNARRDYIRLLNLLTVPRLREIARRRGVTLSGNRRVRRPGGGRPVSDHSRDDRACDAQRPDRAGYPRSVSGDSSRTVARSAGAPRPRLGQTLRRCCAGGSDPVAGARHADTG